MKRKHKNLLKVVLLTLWPLILFGVGFKICSTPSGFDPQRIGVNFVFKQGDGSKYADGDEFRKLQGVLSQKFYFLDSGAQCYAYVSEDQKHVLKFFKTKKLEPKYWLNYLPLPWLEKYRFRKIVMRERRRDEIYDGFYSLYENFRLESALEFVHLNPTNFSSDKVLIVDKTGKEHNLSLNKMPFVLQKRAQMVYPYVHNLFKSNNRSAGIDALISVIELIKYRCQMGYVDKDGGVSNNYGFVDGKPVQIDIGQVVSDESIKEPVNYLREILRISEKMNVWLAKHYPEASEEFQERVQDILIDFSVSLDSV
ncbi:MAG: hypothetical protein FJZ57_04660 [Chlamydiae bacterium]|nr:hypothetical protein [Chlamydiota bacterium]